jgi:uncharacterized HAD superfamily protein/hypoxanthine phosphoribosyltransferase
MQYRSISDLTRVITSNLHLVPQDVDLVVGIPRSGILPAIIISLMLNLRYADLDCFLDGRMAGAGSTKRHAGMIDEPGKARHVLVIDDSVNRGHAMQEAKDRLRAISGETRITYAAVYVVPDGQAQVDVLFEVVPLPRVFEWNLAHHTYLNHACVEIDGVLCRDLRQDENDNGPNYDRFLANASPLHRPTQRIACLVTSRQEKYRPQTEAWLERQGIAYDKLVMLDQSATEESLRPDLLGEFKGKVFRESDAILFLAADHSQAAQIARVAGKPVLSIDRQELLHPDALSGMAAIQRLRTFGIHAKMSDSPLVSKEALKRRLRRVLPESVYATIQWAASRKSVNDLAEGAKVDLALGSPAGLAASAEAIGTAEPCQSSDLPLGNTGLRNGFAASRPDHLFLPSVASPSAGAPVNNAQPRS